MYIFISPLLALELEMLLFIPNTMPFSSMWSISFKCVLSPPNWFQVNNIPTLFKNFICPLSLSWKDVFTFEYEKYNRGFVNSDQGKAFCSYLVYLIFPSPPLSTTTLPATTHSVNNNIITLEFQTFVNMLLSVVHLRTSGCFITFYRYLGKVA